MLTLVFGESMKSRTQVQLWYNRFKEGREDVKDDVRHGCSSTSTTDENIEAVTNRILDNRRITIREVADDVGIYICAAANIIPKLLNFEQKQRCSRDVYDNPDLLRKIINGDESWMYGYDIETRVQSYQWKRSEKPRPKQPRQAWSNVKVLLTVFFDCNGVLYHEFLLQSRTINNEYYLVVMGRLC